MYELYADRGFTPGQGVDHNYKFIRQKEGEQTWVNGKTDSDAG